MSTSPIRRQNLLVLFSEFVAAVQAQDPSRNIAGLDKAFAAQLQIHNTYLSGMKSGARGIGERLARQIEAACSKPRGWLDEEREALAQAKPDRGLQRFMELAEQAYRDGGAVRRAELRALMRG